MPGYVCSIYLDISKQAMSGYVSSTDWYDVEPNWDSSVLHNECDISGVCANQDSLSKQARHIVQLAIHHRDNLTKSTAIFYDCLEFSPLSFSL